MDRGAIRHLGVPRFHTPLAVATRLALRRSRPGGEDRDVNQRSTAMSTFADTQRSDFDYNGPDGTGSFGDILWRDDAGDDVLWLMNNNTAGTIAALPHVTPDWHFKAAADFGAIPSNGNADILWENDNGALALWQMDGTTVSAIHVLPNPGPTWHVVGDNDFNDDLSDDILFQNDNGALAMWTGISAATGTVGHMYAGTQNPGPSWHVVGTGDTNGDHAAGILWQNDDGALALWEGGIEFGTSAF